MHMISIFCTYLYISIIYSVTAHPCSAVDSKIFLIKLYIFDNQSFIIVLSFRIQDSIVMS